ncbi:SusC/RagA family TonB-linked outer membrane protein [Petrimonas sp.]|uniref:SusC/RagA family TonB-linked outer membrane protein n=1 Tax=Petrimonas sp. TaxID=2023866 RepID=UPI003F517557
MKSNQILTIRNIFTSLFSVLVLSVYAQNITVRGTVTYATSDEPVIGATVRIQSSTGSGSVTDIDGNYVLNNVPSGGTLEFSYVGLTTQSVSVGGRSEINIVMAEDSELLEEVVVTALGIRRDKKALGYAVQGVSGDVFNTRPTNALSALTGVVSGLQVISSGGNMGGSSRVTLRGINSITGNNQPLYVIDGVPLDNTDLNTSSTINGSAGKDVGSTIQDINPDDIAEISVLKGPSAAALYGSRAANGVILITTKRGVSDQGRINVEVNTGIEFENIARLPERQKLYGGGYNTTFATATINGKEYKIVDYASDESWGPKLDGTPVLHWYNLDPEYPNDYLNPEPWVYPENDVTYFFRTGVSNTNNVSLSQSSDKHSIRLSLTNRNVTGTVPNSSLDRNSISISGTANGKYVSFFGTVNYLKNKSLGRPWTGASNRNIILEAYQWGMVQIDYKKLQEYKRPDGTPRAWNRTGYRNTVEDERTKYIDNPYWSAYESYLEENRDRLYGTIGIEITPYDWLSVTGRINGDVYQYNSQDRIAVYSRSQSQYSEYSQNYNEFNYELLATITKNWDVHSLVANIGTNYLQRKRRISDIVTSGGLIVPNFYNLTNATSTVINPITGAYNKALTSVYGSVSYGWKSAVYVEGTLRNDWSSTLPQENNSYLYPSLTSSFILSELPALKNSSWLSFAKLRLGWAQVGNDTDPYQLYKVYEALPAINGNIAYTLPSQLNNLNLKPEITSSVETGLQLQFFKNRIGLDVTYYDNTSRNQIISLPTSDAFGYTTKLINAGEINNRGVEVTFNANPVQTRNFGWNSIINFSKNQNKIVKLSDAVSKLDLSTTLVSLSAQEGESYGQLFGYDFVYAPDGRKVVDASGLYMRTQQLRPLGSVLPDYLWGFQNQFRFKNFNLGFLIDSRVGGKFFSQTYKVAMYSGILPETAANGIRETGVVIDGVKADVAFHADGTYTVSNTTENTTNVSAQAWSRNHYSGPTTFDIFDATFIKFRELTLGYNFKLPQQSFIRNINASVYARNLFYLYRASKIIDPELTNSGGNVQGIEGGNLPTPITYGLNLNFKF